MDIYGIDVHFDEIIEDDIKRPLKFKCRKCGWIYIYPLWGSYQIGKEPTLDGHKEALMFHFTHCSKKEN